MVMSIAFDKHDVLHGLSMIGDHRPLLEVDGQVQGAPFLQIDPVSGATSVVRWTGAPNFHGGDIPPATVAVCHGEGQIEVGLAALQGHLNHGDSLPGLDCGCN